MLEYDKDVDFVKEILLHRGIKDPYMFLCPLENPEAEINSYEFKNMKEAVQKTLYHMRNKSNILVIADVDTDGVASGALTYRGLRQLSDLTGSECTTKVIIGDGKTHGISQFPVDELKKYQLIIACDSLSNEYDTYKTLKDNNIDVILLDHHKADHTTEDAIVVNSEMHDSPNTSLSGAGVAYKFIQALSIESKSEFDPKLLADLATVGIVADVMDLSVMDNRYICETGLTNLTNPALKEIIKGYDFNSQSIQFSIAPLINACNRMSSNQLALDLLIEDDPKMVRKLLKQIKRVKEEQDEAVNKEYQTAKRTCVTKNKIAVSKIDNRMFTGLVGNRLADELRLPVIVVHEDNGKFSGSIRSMSNIPFKSIIKEVNLAECEGHEEAAGFFVDKANMRPFLESVEEKLSHYDYSDGRETTYDILIPKEQLKSREIAKKISFANRLSGNGFPPIKVGVKDVMLSESTAGTIKDKHSKFKSCGVEFLKWNDTTVIQHLPRKITVVGTPGMSTFMRKEKVNFIIDNILN